MRNVTYKCHSVRIIGGSLHASSYISQNKLKYSLLLINYIHVTVGLRLVVQQVQEVTRQQVSMLGLLI